MRYRSDYHFDLPDELIAQAPVERRDGSRLLVVDSGPAGRGPAGQAGAGLHDRRFADIADLIPGDAVLVINDVRVIPARLRVQKPTGGRVELLFLESLGPGSPGSERWRCMARSSKSLRPGTRLTRRDAAGEREPPAPVITVVRGHGDDGTVEVAVAGDVLALLEAHGEVPLPPYIARPEGPGARDRSRYQTVYARTPGAVAAPTAGLHFTDDLLSRLRDRGVTLAPITLHVGMGTFAPIRVDDLDEHVMHRERYTISSASAQAINRAVADGRPVVAVGTTSVRALESAAARRDDASPATRGEPAREPGHEGHEPAEGPVTAGRGSTDLFIRPGYRFQVIDRLITNFHLPESTLLMLVSAFAGHERIMAAYRHAVQERYRFFSYGDAMLLTRA